MPVVAEVIVTPNSDTPYSFAWLDLRVEPVVIQVPAMERPGLQKVGTGPWMFPKIMVPQNGW